MRPLRHAFCHRSKPHSTGARYHKQARCEVLQPPVVVLNFAQSNRDKLSGIIVESITNILRLRLRAYLLDLAKEGSKAPKSSK